MHIIKPRKSSIIYILKYIFQSKQIDVNQTALFHKIYAWKNCVPGNYFYRPYSEKIDDENKKYSRPFIYCVQTDFQKDLLGRYGMVMLLDVTYKTTKYSLPLFNLVVKTNVSYIIVGVFIIQFETSVAITEALNIFKNWNSELNPTYILVDYSESEINTIEACFLACLIYIYDFHRERVWERWLKTRKNIPEKVDADELLKEFRNLAAYKTNEELI